MTDPCKFEFSRTVWMRRQLGLVVVGAIGSSMVAAGLWLTPGTIGSIQGFFSGFLIFGGVTGVAYELLSLLAYSNPKSTWQIRLCDKRFTWASPRHLWRTEEDFDLPLSAIERLVRVSHSEDDQLRPDEYWLVVRDQRKIRLRDYSGVSLPALFGVAQALEMNTESRSGDLHSNVSVR